jgi:galactose mutarotase-like enzyme
VNGCSLTDEYSRQGVPCLWLENDSLRVEILAGKGGDITEIRDKRTDVNVLFETPHEWRPPAQGPVGTPDDAFAFLDHYPGGWQDVLPAAGGPSEGDGGTPLGLHGESTVIPLNVEVLADTTERIAVELTAELTRYPLAVERKVALEAGDPTLHVSETVTNVGEVGVHYSWLQHIALGGPLVSPAAELSVPCERVLVDPGQTDENARLPPGSEFDWPVYEGDEASIDLQEFPPRDERVHDLVALTDLAEGRYTVTNPDLDLGVTVAFSQELYEYLWYWQPFGGFEESPFFGRNYNVGLEPCTSVPNAGLDAAKDNGTSEYLPAGESESTALTFSTHPAESDVS